MVLANCSIRAGSREVGRLGINVNAVAPRFLATDMTHGLVGERRRKIVRRSALRRLASLDEVANAVEFLLGDKSQSVSGTVFDRRRWRYGLGPPRNADISDRGDVSHQSPNRFRLPGRTSGNATRNYQHCRLQRP